MRILETRRTAHENFRNEMAAISRISKSMDYAMDGVRERLRFQRDMRDESLLAKARAFIFDVDSYRTNERKRETKETPLLPRPPHLAKLRHPS